MQPGAVVLVRVGGQEGIILIVQFVELYVGFTALGHFDNPLATPSLQFYKVKVKQWHSGSIMFQLESHKSAQRQSGMKKSCIFDVGFHRQEL